MLRQLLRQLLDAATRPRSSTPSIVDSAAHIERSQQARAKGDLHAAEALLRESVAASPSAIAHAFLAELLKASGREAEARLSYEHALALDPAQAELRLNYAACLKQLGEVSAAEREYGQVIAERPEWAPAYVNYGLLAVEQADWGKALTLLRRATALAPNLLEAHVNLSFALKATGNLAEAVHHCECALLIDAASIPALSNLAALLHERGDADGARTTLCARVARAPSDGAAIAKALALPSILESREHIERVRHRLDRELDKLLNSKLSVRDPAREIRVTPFHLAYHGSNDRALQQKIAAVHLRACPALAHAAPHCISGRRRSGRVRVGVVSRFLYNHSIGRVTHGLVRELDRRRFSVHAFSFQPPFDSISRDIAHHAEQWITLRPDLSEARAAIERCELDVLLYPDIGMDPLTYFLAFARLAPVQCTTWGHPVTSGIPAIDYFLSTDYFDLPESGEHYSEKIVRLRDVAFPGYYVRPVVPADRPEASAAARGWRTYLCPQALFKFHPDFDVILERILREDATGKVMLVREGGGDDYRLTVLQSRLRRTLGDVYERVEFLPRAPTREDYLQRLQTCDVVLDTVHYCGGNTSLEAISAGAPVVTLPSAFNRGRHTYGFFRKLRLTDTVATSSEHYVELALRVAADRVFRSELKVAQKRSVHALFEDASAVTQLERFFEEALFDAGIA